jgi:hypothetical protein
LVGNETAEIVAGTWKAARAHTNDITEADARAALQQLGPLWDELFPAEQARIVALLVERVDIGTDAASASGVSARSADRRITKSCAHSPESKCGHWRSVRQMAGASPKQSTVPLVKHDKLKVILCHCCDHSVTGLRHGTSALRAAKFYLLFSTLYAP